MSTPRAFRPPAGNGYADRYAADYDRWFAKPGVTGATVQLLAGLADTGPVLELGVGTGRIAVPLAAHGFIVHGVEASAAMARRLREKPGGARVSVTLGDFTEVPAPGTYTLVYCVGGTFLELPDRSAQQRCFAAVAERLRPGGVFVVDAHVPEALVAAAASEVPETVVDRPGLRVLCHRSVDPATRTYHSHYLVREAGRTHHLDVRFHYLSVDELDELATAVGLHLTDRHGSWSGEPFTDSSAYHVSVYERP
ncbi:class I SAM-dependent methyltransferase [Kitasatospora sp. NPDC093806]|uniref:class I SAM-dependent DNA methyltransferase n=1 Tax=Kitasatospora sp. NPDC093806 TaxID=3155075 RepID=UPI003448CD85